MISPDRITHVVRDDLTLDVLDAGPLRGEPVVLLHGFPQRASSWGQVTPLLHRSGLRTLALDQRGYSPGARPRSRAAYRLDEAVADLLALVDEVNRPVHLVGHDWGAAVGWIAAAHHPAQVLTFTAVSVPHPGAMVWAGLRSGQPLRSWYVAAFQLPWVPELVLSSRWGERALAATGMPAAALARYRTEVVESGALAGGLGWYRGLPHSHPDVLRSRVTVPTTMVWSDGDTAIGRSAARGAERYVDAPYTYVELAGTSHWVPEEEPGALAEAVLARIASVSNR
jgi:pimeloyl-ACP methyl ester carboxylesterase